MDFTGIYAREPWMCTHKEDWISFQKLEGRDGYCTQEAAQEIRREIMKKELEDLHFLDSGNYHYLTKFWLERIREPFDLVVFDRHSDMQPAALLPLTSCGNWLLESLQEMPLLRQVWLMGVSREQIDQIPAQYRNRLQRVAEEEAKKGPVYAGQALPIPFSSYPLYLSIDKDVLSKDQVPVNWDQGEMSLDILVQWLEVLCWGSRILGADICGEPANNVSNPGLDKDCRRNDAANRRLAELLLPLFHQ